MLIILTITITTNKDKKRSTTKLIEVMDIPFILIVVIVSWVYAYVQTHQLAYIFLYQLRTFFYINYVSVKPFFKLKT